MLVQIYTVGMRWYYFKIYSGSHPHHEVLLFHCSHWSNGGTTPHTDDPIPSVCWEKYFFFSIFQSMILCLPAMTYDMVSGSWISPLCETGTTIVHMADSLRVTMATSLMAEVSAGDRRWTKGAATEPVELETKPRDSVSQGKEITKVEMLKKHFREGST